MDIREAVTPAEKVEIYRLRYHVLVEELGWTIAEADHRAKQFSDPLDKTGILVGAYEGDALWGALRINLARDGGLGDYEDLYAIDREGILYPDRIGILTKLFVATAHRRSMAVPRMLLWAFARGLRDGISQAYLDCSLDLIPFYEKIGFVPYTDDVETETHGVVAPMRIDLTDIDYLERIRSPVRRVLTQYDQGHIDAYLASRGAEDGEVFPIWSQGAGDRTAVRVFDGLTSEQLALAFRAASLKTYADGEAIFVEGAPSWEFGVIVKGRAAVTQHLDGKDQVVALYSRGQVIGEMGFLRDEPRSATVTALGECEVAMLPTAVMEHLLRKEPDIAVRLYRNMAVILAERLAHAHDGLGQRPGTAGE
ncbi:MAG: cyclic nucleotide-binding domain-containing protein [Rhodospirillum sp.]|nr:cyclic nucleotide-binding domain-containing protein [Rhodospirillum sp.]MCF8489880.1 cyclic nucleotide-binding domain-containing protein [Rhodospirillum sp.]MCF8501825.1 cyclic nucleotide-binding domain-containing protein [Rhodospirillum sp.]